ncbi:MAG TPA: EamA/RhaT family transporter [Acidimicrobiaceae bacterium]|nr:EamA family transporter [Acidimicrobiaceae bacterium]MDP7258840.1 DMT family transporter [Acidimicrobiales bacterium]HCV36198.1 EamA/RhaT family transporter [Acidimicrobiaceae bacterium]HJO80299.1 DMT family transporter [Acidimicrobiales bacterium]
MNNQTIPPVEGRPFAPLDWLLLVSAAGIWGASFLFMDVALEVEHPGLITFLRPALGLLVVLCFPSAHRPVDRADRGRLLLLSITWMAFPLTMFPLAQQWIDSSLAGMLNSSMPVMTVVVGAAFFRTKTGKTQVMGVLTGLVGILLVGLPTATTGGTNAVGVLLVMMAVASYGVAAHIAGPLQRQYGSAAVLSRVLAVATIVTMPLGMFGLLSSAWAWGAVASNVAVGVGGTGLAFLAAATLIGRVGAVRMSTVTYLVTIVAALLGVFVLGETLSIWQVAGGLVLLGGVWLTSRVDL